jgi:hypothetical protein
MEWNEHRSQLGGESAEKAAAPPTLIEAAFQAALEGLLIVLYITALGIIVAAWAGRP